MVSRAGCARRAEILLNLHHHRRELASSVRGSGRSARDFASRAIGY